MDYLIAMVMVFLAFSVMVSGATEMWNSWLGKRGQFLWKGVERMVGNSPEAMLILDKLRAHPTIRALAQDDTAKRTPSYIPGTVFAAALTDVILALNAGARLDKYGLPEAIALLPQDLPLKGSLQMAWSHARGDAAHFELELARLYDDCMDRVSGWYKRDAQVRGLWLGLLLAAVLNIDAVHIAISLWQDQQLTRSVADQGAAMAAQYAAANPNANTASAASSPASSISGPSVVRSNNTAIALPQELPVGWPPRWYSELPAKPTPTTSQLAWHVAAAVLGVLLMAGSCLVGAPMWYQMLASLLPLRFAGAVPPRTPPRAALPPPSGAPESGGSAPAGTAPGVTLPAAAGGTGQKWVNELERVIVEQDAVREVQKSLGVPESGSLDDPTRAAIRTRQISEGYAPTGQLTRLLLRNLGLGDRY
jgi:hypothetical protein